MEDKIILEKLIEYVKEDSIKALGCTEPVAVAFAGYEAGKHISNEEIRKVIVKTSKNIYKNGKSVKIPNSNGAYGLDLAAVIGLFSRGSDEDPSLIFKNLNEEILKRANNLISEGVVDVSYLEEVPNIYISIIVETNKKTVESIVAYSHTHLEKIIINNNVEFENKYKTDTQTDDFNLKELSVKKLKNLIDKAEKGKFNFTLNGIEINKKAAKEGLKGYGSNLGKTLNELKNKKVLEDNFITNARILTAAAADMRMGGGECEIVTSGGSGNQGIGVILPIAVVAEFENVEDEKLSKALFFAHILNRYVKEYSGKLSGICGCAIGSAIGATAGITYMLGGSEEQIEGACSNIYANLTGIICDGAKESCSMKLSTCAEESIVSAYLALNNMITDYNVGIVGTSIEDTILNIGKLSKNAFNQVDEVMLEIINR